MASREDEMEDIRDLDFRKSNEFLVGGHDRTSIISGIYLNNLLSCELARVGNGDRNLYRTSFAANG